MIGGVALFVISGVSAAGKSTVARLLAERFERGACMPGDVIRAMMVSGRVDMRPNAGAEALGQLVLRYAGALSVASVFLNGGFDVVVEDVITGPVLRDFLDLVPVEELHTAFELTLARVIYGRYRRGKQFWQLVDEASAQGTFDKVRGILPFTPAYDPATNSIDPQYAPAPYVTEQLTSLKDTRNPVKHRGDTSARGWLEEHFDAAATVLERLAGLARTQPAALQSC
jgi:hypothetical protein